MTQRPIRQDSPTTVERELLDSARLDAPEPAARARALARLDVVGAAASTTGPGAAVASWPPLGGPAKWLALGALGAALAVGGVEGLEHFEHRGGAASSNTASSDAAGTTHAVDPVVQSHRVAPEIEPLARPEDREKPAHPAGRTRAKASKGVSITAKPSPAETSEPDLGAEVSALEEVRRELASGHVVVSLGLLDAYDRRFSKPRLGPEARLLRLEALIASGHVDRAAKLGERLLADQPDGAYGQRVRTLLGEAETTNR